MGKKKTNYLDEIAENSYRSSSISQNNVNQNAYIEAAKKASELKYDTMYQEALKKKQEEKAQKQQEDAEYAALGKASDERAAMIKLDKQYQEEDKIIKDRLNYAPADMEDVSMATNLEEDQYKDFKDVKGKLKELEKKTYLGKLNAAFDAAWYPKVSAPEKDDSKFTSVLKTLNNAIMSIPAAGTALLSTYGDDLTEAEEMQWSALQDAKYKTQAPIKAAAIKLTDTHLSEIRQLQSSNLDYDRRYREANGSRGVEVQGEYNEQQNYLDRAETLLEHKRELDQDFLDNKKGVRGLFDGLGNQSEEYASLGLISTIDEQRQKRLNEKRVNKEEWTKEESAFMNAMDILKETKATQSPELSWYNTGTGLQSSLVMMAQTVAAQTAMNAVIPGSGAPTLFANTVKTWKGLSTVQKLGSIGKVTGSLLASTAIQPASLKFGLEKQNSSIIKVKDVEGNEKYLSTDAEKASEFKALSSAIKTTKYKLSVLNRVQDPTAEQLAEIKKLQRNVNHYEDNRNILFEPTAGIDELSSDKDIKSTIRNREMSDDDARIYGFTQNLKENVSEIMVGPLAGKMFKVGGNFASKTFIPAMGDGLVWADKKLLNVAGSKLGQTVGSGARKFGRVAATKFNDVSDATYRTFSRGRQVFDNAVDGNAIGKLSRSFVNHVGPAKVMHSIPEEIMEEIAVQATPTYMENYSKQLESLYDFKHNAQGQESSIMDSQAFDFYARVTAQTAVMGAGFSTAGASTHYFNMASNKEYRTQYEANKADRDMLKKTFFGMDQSITDEQLAQDIAMSTAGSIFQINDYNARIADLRNLDVDNKEGLTKEQRLERANILENKSFLNLAIQSVETGTTKQFRKSLEALSKRQGISAETQANAVKGLAKLEVLEDIKAKHSNKLNGGRLMDLETRRTLNEDAIEDLDRKIERLEPEVTTMIEDFKAANGFTDVQFDTFNFNNEYIINENLEEEGQESAYNNFVARLSNESSPIVGEYLSAQLTKEMLTQENNQVIKDFNYETNPRNQEKIRERELKAFTERTLQNVTPETAEEAKAELNENELDEPEVINAINTQAISQTNVQPIEEEDRSVEVTPGEMPEGGYPIAPRDITTEVFDNDTKRGLSELFDLPLETPVDNTEEAQQALRNDEVISQGNLFSAPMPVDLNSPEHVNFIEKAKALFGNHIKNNAKTSFYPIMGRIVNDYGAVRTEERFKLFVEAWNNVSNDKVSPETANSIYTEFFGDEAININEALGGNTVVVQTSNPAVETPAAEESTTPVETVASLFGTGPIRTYFGRLFARTGLKAGFLGLNYRETEDGKETVSTDVNENALPFIDYRNFRPGSQLDLTFNYEYLLNPENKVTKWKDLNSNPTRVSITVVQALKEMFPDLTYAQVSDKIRNNPTELAQNIDFLKMVPVGIVNNGLADSELSILPGGLNDYNWFNISNVALLTDENGELMPYEREERIRKNRELNLDTRRAILAGQSITVTVEDRTPGESNRLLKTTEKEKSQGHSDTFQSLVDSYKDGTMEDALENSAVGIVYDKQIVGEGKPNQEKSITIGGKEIAVSSIVNWDSFKELIDKKENKVNASIGKMVIVYQNGIDGAGKPTYIMHGVINNHPTQQSRFRNIVEIKYKLDRYRKILTGEVSNGTPEEIEKAEKIFSNIKTQFGLDLKLKGNYDDVMDLFPEEIRVKDANGKSKGTGEYRQNLSPKKASYSLAKRIPNLNNFNSVAEFEQAFLTNNIEETSYKEIIYNNVHTEFKQTSVSNNGEKIWSNEVQPVITYSNAHLGEVAVENNEQKLAEDRLAKERAIVENQLKNAEKALEEATSEDEKVEQEALVQDLKKTFSKIESATPTTTVKKGVEDILKENPELSAIGTAIQYSQYLSTIFPNSQVGDILYHGGPSLIPAFKTKEASVRTWNYFTDKKERAEGYGEVTSVIIDSKFTGENDFAEVEGHFGEILDDGTAFFVESTGDEYAVQNSEQIHVLGSKKDIAGFQKFLGVEAAEEVKKEFNSTDVFQVVENIVFKALARMDITQGVTKTKIYEMSNKVFNELIAELEAKGMSQEVEFILENREEILGEEGNYDNSMKEAIDAIFNLSQEEDITSLTGENVKDFSKESYENNIADSLSFKIKVLLSGIPDTRVDSSENFAGLVDTLSFNDALDALQQIMAEISNNTIEEVEKAIKQKRDLNAEEFAFYDEILKRLKDIKSIDVSVLNEILYNLYQPKVKMAFVLYNRNYDGSYTLESYDANTKNPLFVKRAKWNENIKNSPVLTKFEEGFYKINEPVHKELNALYKKIMEGGKKAIDIKAYFETVGVKLNNKMYLILEDLTHPENKKVVNLITGPTGILRNINDNLNTAAESKKTLAFTNRIVTDTDTQRAFNILTYNNSQINDLIHADNAVSFIPMNMMYIGGKMISVYEQPKRIANILKKFTSDPAFRQQLKASQITSDNMMLNLIDGDPSLEGYVDVIMTSLEALKERGAAASDKMGITQLSNKDGFVTMFNMFASSEGAYENEALKRNGVKLRKGMIPFPTLSDSSQLPLFKTIVIDVQRENVAGDTVSENILDILKSQLLKGDLKRIAAFLTNGKSTNIKGHDAGAMFITGMSSLNTVIVDSNYIVGTEERTGKRTLVEVFRNNPQFHTEAGIENFLTKYKTEIDAEIIRNVNYEVDAFISEDGKTGSFITNEIFNPRRGLSFIDKKYLDSKGLGKGLEQARLVAYDYVINTMIQQKEIQTTFAGDVANYFKDSMSKDLVNGHSVTNTEDIINHYYKKNKGQITKLLNKGDYITLFERYPKLRFSEEFISFDISHEEQYAELLPVIQMKTKKMFEGVQNNLSKRLKELISPGNQFPDSKGNKIYKQLMLQDVDSASEVLLDLVELYHPELLEEVTADIEAFKALDNIYETNRTASQVKEHDALYNTLKGKLPKMSGFMKTASTDAQEYTSWLDNLDQLLEQGRLFENEYEAIKDKLTKQEDDLEKNGVISEENRMTREEMSKAMMQPSKPLYSGLHFEKHGDYNLQRDIYIKSSSFPILPEMAAMFPKLNQIRKTIKKIQNGSENTIVRISYDSANKVGAVKNAVTMADVYNDKTKPELLASSTVELDRQNFYIQQDKPFKSDKNAKAGKVDTVTRATQFEKILLGDGISQITQRIFPNAFDADLLEEIGAPTEGLLTGPELKKIYNEIYKREQKIYQQNLFNKLGIKEYSEIGQGKISSMEKLANLLNQRLTNKQDKQGLELVYHVKNSGKTYSKAELAKEGLTAYRAEFKMPIYMSPNSRKFESVLNSVINKNSVNLHLPGFSSPVASQEGFDFKGYESDSAVDVVEIKSLIKNTISKYRNRTEEHKDTSATRAKENNKVGDTVTFSSLGNFRNAPKKTISKVSEDGLEFEDGVKLRYAEIPMGAKNNRLYSEFEKTHKDFMDSLDLKRINKELGTNLELDMLEGISADGIDALVAKANQGKESMLSRLKKQGLITTKNFDPAKGLQATRNEDGSLKFAQVFIANKYKVKNIETGAYDYIDLKNYVNEQGQIDTTKLPEELLSMFSFRIPTSSHQSGVIIEVAGFLPHNVGDLMIVPKDHTVQIGEDYDIDTRYVYQYNYIETPTGLKKLQQSDLSNVRESLVDTRQEFEDYKQELFDEYFTVNIDNNAPIGISSVSRNNPYWNMNREALMNITILEDSLENYNEDSLLNAIFEDEYDFSPIATKEEMRDKINELRASLIPKDMLRSKAQELKEEYKQIKKDLRIAYNNDTKKIKQAYKRYGHSVYSSKNQELVLQNNMVSLYKAVFGTADKGVQGLINKTLSTDFAEDTAKAMNDKINQDTSNIYNIYSPTTQMKLMALGADGKMGIGVHSNAVTMNSLLQQLGSQPRAIKSVDEEGNYVFFDIKLGAHLTFDGIFGRVERGGFRISESGMESQNSATDNQKLQIMGQRNENADSINVFTLLQATGLDNDGLYVDGKKQMSYASLFINQPIMREYTALVSKYKSSTNTEKGNPEKLAVAALEAKYFPFIAKDKWVENPSTKKPILGKFTPKVLADLGNGLTSQKMWDELTGENMDIASQLYVLKRFNELKGPAKEYNRLQKFINIENGGLGISYFDTIELMDEMIAIASGDINITNANEMVGDLKRESDPATIKELLADDYIFVKTDKNGVTYLIKPTNHYSHKIVNSISAGYNLWDSMFPYESEFIEEQLEDILNISGVNSPTDKKELKYKIIASLKDYIYSNSPALFSSDTVGKSNELFYDRNSTEDTEKNVSLASYILELSNTPAFKYLFKLPLFKDFQFNINEGGYPSILIYNNNDVSKLNNINTNNALARMVNSNKPLLEKNGKPFTEKDLMKELLMYSLLANQENGAIGFRQVLPIDLFDAHGVTENLRGKSNFKNPLLQNLLYNGLSKSVESLLGSRISNVGVIQNENNVPVQDIYKLISVINRQMNADAKTTDVVYLKVISNSGAVEFSNYDGGIKNGSFVRQYVQHNPTTSIGIKYEVADESEDEISKFQMFLNANGISSRTNAKGAVDISDLASFTLQPYQYAVKYDNTSEKITSKRKINSAKELNVGETAIFESPKFMHITDSNGITRLYELTAENFYERIPTLGTFGMNEYQAGRVVNKSSIAKNNVKKFDNIALPPSEMGAILTQEDAAQVLNSVYAEVENPYRPLIEMFAQVTEFSKVKVVVVPSLPGAGQYNPNTNTVSISQKFLDKNPSRTQFLDVLTEELVHAATVRAIDTYVDIKGIDNEGNLQFTFKPGMEIPDTLLTMLDVFQKGINVIIKEQGLEKVKNNLSTLSQKVSNNESGTLNATTEEMDDIYRVSNIHEFIAGIFMKNTKFATKMAETPYTKNGMSILEKFSELLTRLINNILPNKRMDSLSANMALNLYQFLSETKAVREATESIYNNDANNAVMQSLNLINSEISEQVQDETETVSGETITTIKTKC